MMAPHFFVGLDLGQQNDPTAIAVLERTSIRTGFDRVHWVPIEQDVYHLRHLERIPLKTTYAAIVAHVRELMQPLAPRVTLIVDATGLGGPIVEMLKAARLPGPLIPVTITSGDRENGTHVPKKNLISNLQILFELGELKIAAGLEETKAFIQELTTMQVKITPSARETFSPAKSTDHDDLVLAAALAAWKARQKPVPLFINRRLI
jgi:hypothetical protein